MVAPIDAADVLEMGTYCNARRRDVLAAALGWAPRVHTSQAAAPGGDVVPEPTTL